MINIRASILHYLKQEIKNLNDADFADMKQAMAESLLKSIHDAYIVKSYGSRGDDGIQWAPTKRFLQRHDQMLIRTGHLLEFFRIVMQVNGFKIVNRVKYAKYQLNKRLPWPTDGIPELWVKRMLEAAKPYLKKAVKKAATKAAQRATTKRTRVK